ncbi:Neuronal calcium sensor 2 [Brachionus plicatilis]|uniref:Neuronal calcium sensor 2 n=1 Tax=Brachionus plicatilis TaxID=10195 RepID=A0A3M7PY97_BRAPC|nr:Neuronal calcium sensor 2 [Brachionus plicatilis]
MGLSHTKLEPIHYLKNKLGKAAFEKVTERDYDFISYQTGRDRDQVKETIDKFLETHSDGLMNKSEYCQLYQSLRQDSAEKLFLIFENVFRALGIQNPEADLISMKEFLITFCLTSLGDFRKKLEYAFELYDLNGDGALEIEEAKEAIFGIMELFRAPKEKTISEITNECMQSVKITCTVKKDDFIQGLSENKRFSNVINIFK